MKNKLFVALVLLLVSTFGITVQAQVVPDVTTYIKTYANFASNVQEAAAPEDVQATSDGGYILLGASSVPHSAPISLLVKIDSSGNTQWVKELGVFTPGVSYAIGTSVQQTSDGGYIIAGGTAGGGPGPCSPRIGIQCALVEKLNSSGNLQWAFVYVGGVQGGTLNQIRQTADGGYIAVGGTIRDEGIYGGLILRLNAAGSVLWQKALGPEGSTLVELTQVVLTSDGGFATLGYTYVPQNGPGIESVLVSKYTAAGVQQWQYAYNEPDGHQAPFTFAQTSDGGYIVGGTTGTLSGGEVGGLLLKLGPRGNIQWQKAYFSLLLGGVTIYSVHQMPDGGVVLVGDSSGGPCGGLTPWMAKVDSSGNPLWEHRYYQNDNGCSLSEYFASSTLTADGGILANGWTEDYSAGLSLLYVVKTDGAGLCSAGCQDIYSVPQATASDISLKPMLAALPVNTTITPGAPSPSQTQVTTAVVMQDCD